MCELLHLTIRQTKDENHSKKIEHKLTKLANFFYLKASLFHMYMFV